MDKRGNFFRGLRNALERPIGRATVLLGGAALVLTGCSLVRAKDAPTPFEGLECTGITVTRISASEFDVGFNTRSAGVPEEGRQFQVTIDQHGLPVQQAPFIESRPPVRVKFPLGTIGRFELDGSVSAVGFQPVPCGAPVPVDVRQ